MSDDWTPDFGQLDAAAPAWAPKRPVRIAVLGDFSAGAARGRLDTGLTLARRKLIPVEFDSLEDLLARWQVQLSLPLGEGGAGVELALPTLDAFHPEALYRELPIFQALAGLRQRLNNTATFAKAAAEVQSWSEDGKEGAHAGAKRSRRGRSRSGAPAADARLSDFARLVGLPTDVKTDGPVDALLRQVVGPYVLPAPDAKRDALVATVDRALSAAMRSVLHHPEFQNLESLWRGVDMLLRRIETGPALQVLLVDVSAEEFAADLSSVSDLADSGLYSMLVGKPSQDKTGGLSLICGLYQFEATPPHAELLGRMAKIAAQANAPFVTAMNSDAFVDRKRPPHGLVAQAMKALRFLPEASHLALLSPRFMLRQLYGARSDPIEAFDFEEFTAADGLRGMLWGHPAILAASVLAAPTGPTLSIGELAFHYYVDGEGDQVALPCTERLINAELAAQMRQFGLTALMAHKGQPELRLAGLDAVNGSAIALQLAAKPAARMGISTAVQSKLDVRSSPPKVAAAPASDDNSGDADSGSSDDSSSDAGDTSLDDLLASLGGDDSASSDDSGSSDGGGGDSSDGAGGGDDEMDPDLAALLKSLEG